MDLHSSHLPSTFLGLHRTQKVTFDFGVTWARHSPSVLPTLQGGHEEQNKGGTLSIILSSLVEGWC